MTVTTPLAKTTPYFRAKSRHSRRLDVDVLDLNLSKGCKQTERDYTTRRDSLFLKVNKTFNGKSKIWRPNSSNCQYVAKSLKKMTKY